MIDYRLLVKKLTVPAGFVAPRRLVYQDIEARVLSRDDLAEDVQGINVSLDLIRKTRGGPWPTGPVTAEEDFVDLVWHELEFREDLSYSYAVYSASGTYLGCCYLYPMGRRTELTEALASFDVDVSWWVTPAAYDLGHYVTLYRALGQWLGEAFPFTRPYYSNREIPG